MLRPGPAGKGEGSAERHAARSRRGERRGRGERLHAVLSWTVGVARGSTSGGQRPDGRSKRRAATSAHVLGRGAEAWRFSASNQPA